ncbi:hypothetical protein AB0N21_00455 [Streptomyces sp. NPDC051080]|uniref:hypothetical protein n=1 Tax=Streptomyces sp. NPDC051080 TaxID=3157222 RepID=UPI0034306874
MAARVFVDTNVLFPFSVMDVTITDAIARLAKAGLPSFSDLLTQHLGHRMA